MSNLSRRFMCRIFALQVSILKGVYPLEASFSLVLKYSNVTFRPARLTLNDATPNDGGMSTESHIILRLRAEADKKRAAALDRAEKAQREADRFAVEVEAYDKAINAMERAGVAEALKDIDIDVDTPPRTGASGKWVSIYKALHDTADPPYSYEDLSAAVDLAGHQASAGGQRTQMMNAVKAGWFDRVGHGKFQFTDSGLALIGADPSGNSDAAASEEAKAEDAGGIFGLHNPQPVPPGTQD
jgi:hypothetical protein